MAASFPGVQVRVEREYANVLDGFALSAPVGSLEEIRGVAGVKAAFLEREGHVSDAAAVDAEGGTRASPIEGQYPANLSAQLMMRTDQVTQKGEGKVVAIIDTGVDMTHQAFTPALTATPALSKDRVDELKAQLGEGKTGVYVNEKFPFAYDYADGDNDASPREGGSGFHGTHVAGIAAGNADKIVGSSHFGVWGWCWHGVGACPMIEVATLQTLGGPDMGNGTFSALDMTTYCGLVELGLVAVGMRCQEGGFVLKCRAVNPARLCPGCGRPGDALGSRTRRLAHEPRGHQPTMLVVYVGRYRCRACSRSWCDDISQAAPPRAKLSFGALRWGLVCLIADNMSINRIAAHLAVAWHTANEAILAYGEELLLADSTRFEGVRVIGVDEHVWRHRGGDRYATVIVDLTPVRDHTGPARLLDVVQGRSKHVLSSWLAACPQEWKDNIEIVAMDGFSGYKSAAASQLPGAVTVMDPFHVVHIAIDALEQCRQRVQQETLGHRGRKGDPLYAARKTLLTGTDILTDTSQARLDALFACPDHADVHATWRIYQDLLAAYRDRDPRRGKNTLRQLITTLTRPGLPHTCIELARMGRTFTRRAGDILAYFDHPHTSNGPTEAINGRLEHLRGIAQGFVNHRNYRLRCLLHSGGFQHLLHP